MVEKPAAASVNFQMLGKKKKKMMMMTLAAIWQTYRAFHG